MKIRKVITGSAIAFALTAPAGTALAAVDETASAPTATDTSTTVPGATKPAKSPEYRTALTAWQDATRAWVDGRVDAMNDYRQAVATASATLKSALASATTKDARKAAMEAFKSARDSAKSALDAALASLGTRPARPTR